MIMLIQNLTNSNADLNWFCIKINKNNRHILLFKNINNTKLSSQLSIIFKFIKNK